MEGGIYKHALFLLPIMDIKWKLLNDETDPRPVNGYQF